MKYLLKLLFICFIIIFLCGGLGLFFIVKNTSFNKPPPTSVINEQILWSLIQDWRKNNNLQPYIKDQNTCNLAYIRASEIQTDFSHNSFNNHTNDFSYYKLGENIAKGSSSSHENDILNIWINSPSHRENLDYPYTHSCISCLNNKCVQIFADYF